MEIREITTIPDLEKVQKLEMAIWGTPPVPIHQTLTVVKNGGIVVGAYLEEELVGFSYGFAGFQNGKPYLTSHMLGIAKHLRGKGIGEALKQEQRKLAIQRGYDMMIWTYDPLETRNAYLNLTKLHGICDTYIENCYGEMQDGLNKGLPSDRFQVKWLLNANIEEQKQLLLSSTIQPIVNYEMNRQGLPVLKPFDPNQSLECSMYSLPVPLDFQRLKAMDPQLALDWRFKTRSIIQILFSHGFVAIHLEKGKEVHHYVLVKKELLTL